MKKRIIPVTLGGAAVLIAALTLARVSADAGGDVARGKYLVTVAGCNDCHTPWKPGKNGPPEPDMTRLLSGHPEQLTMPPAPASAEGPWMVTGAGTMTAWAGPWGVSFAANLTPDAETGMGKWTEKDFVDAMRSGRHMGRGRPILPPMPVQNVGAMTDADLRAVFAYLRSIPAIKNRVPEPRPPALADAKPAR
ncbi:c-type cytochrome [Anaeromyxobacter terrae]|uniref:c-type cytochrome n=1 Tax=Anaeromyxobacter terrae TaxID=2925406 RepID=UPI001F55FE6D|nr:c-type cytochrome [Anaeromyxobacter sp. SG22]